MDPAAAQTLYRVSQERRFLELLIQPWLAIAGAAIVVYTIVKFLPLLRQAREFLAHGWVAWLAAAPVALILVPFLLLYGGWCARSVFACWRDAVSGSTATTEGTVGLAASDRYGFMSGRSYVSGTATRLSVDGHMFNSLPEGIVRQIQVGDRVRVVHTPHVNYVVQIVRLGPGQ